MKNFKGWRTRLKSKHMAVLQSGFIIEYLALTVRLTPHPNANHLYSTIEPTKRTTTAHL